METYTLRAKADQEGVLRVEIPGTAETEYDLIVVLQPTAMQSEDQTDVPPPGSAARMVYEAQRAGIHADGIVDASRTDEILRDEFADHLLKRMRDDNGAE